MSDDDFELGHVKRNDRTVGVVLAAGLFLMWTGSVPPVLQYSAATLLFVWIWTLLLRQGDGPARGYSGDVAAWRRYWDRLNFRYALARSMEVLATFVAALALWTGRERLPARIPPFDAKLIVSLSLSLVAIGFLGAFAVSVSRGDPIEVRSQWGGLGGSGGGWRISRPMVCLMAAAVFGGLTALTNLSIAKPESSKAAAVAEAKAPPEEASKTTSAPPAQKSTAPPANAGTPEKK